MKGCFKGLLNYDKVLGQVMAGSAAGTRATAGGAGACSGDAPGTHAYRLLGCSTYGFGFRIEGMRSWGT